MNISCSDDVLYEATVNSLFHEYFDDTCQIFDDIDQLFCMEHAKTLTPAYMESTLFEEAEKMPDEKKAYNKGFVERIGAAIKSLLTSIKTAFDNFMSHFRKNDKQMQVNTAKLAEAIRKDPSMKNKVLQGVQAGLISTRDLEEINKFNDEYEKLMMEKNPKTLRGKLANFKKKWDDMDFLKKAGAITTTVSAGFAIYTLVPKIRETMGKTSEYHSKSSENLNKMMKDIQNAGMDPEKMDAYQLKLAAEKYRQGKMNEFYAVLNGNYSKLNSAMGSVITHLPGGKGSLAKEKEDLLSKAGSIELQQKYESLAKINASIKSLLDSGKDDNDKGVQKKKEYAAKLEGEIKELKKKYEKGGKK